MDHATLTATARRFPLLGRPRPDCPALPLRIQDVTDAADTAIQKLEHGMADAAHALNKAALIASDAGMAELARELCWQHIDTYCRAARPLTVLEARYMLEPVLNLARLQIRADQGTPALELLEAMYEAVTKRTDLTIGDHTLPTAHLLGEQAERRKLREWVWLQLLGEGIRTLALANRWADAAEHAHTHNGVGAHLMEGRQAVIIAACIRGDLDEGRKLLAGTTLTQPWEQQVAACLQMMCPEPGNTLMAHHLAIAMRRLAIPGATANFASFRARLGLTVAMLSSAIRPELTTGLLSRVAKHAIETADGYAARDVLGFRERSDGITEWQRIRLRSIATEAGLGLGALPEEIVRGLTTAADVAVKVLDVALHSAA
jgi:hypothetical protein